MNTVPNIHPTPEQRAVIASRGRRIRINARAGTGKTTTLHLLAERERNSRILYLVFNRRAREQAAAILPRNVEVSTVHSFAFTRGARRYEVDGNFSSTLFLDAFRSDAQALALLCREFLSYFLSSVYGRLEDAVPAFLLTLSGERAELFRRSSAEVVQAARTAASRWQTGALACPHDFYLKMFHKSGRFLSALSRYDIVLVDEGQDLTELVLDVLARTGTRVFLVGDTHQQIYGFRYAVDAMRKLPADEEYDLSVSFRFGHGIAELASAFIREGKGEPGFAMTGNPRIDSVIQTYGGSPEPSARADSAILSRTNLSLFENAIGLTASGVPFRFERGITGLVGKTFDVYWLSKEYRKGIRDPLIGSFPSLKALDAYALQMEDSELRSLSRIVSRYGSEFPGALYGIMERQKADRGVVLSTVHAAKGREYDEVHLDPDIGDALESASDSTDPLAAEEYNIAYVAMTRARRRLALPRSLRDAVSPEWRKRFDSCPDRAFAKWKDRRAAAAVSHRFED